VEEKQHFQVPCCIDPSNLGQLELLVEQELEQQRNQDLDYCFFIKNEV
jgi:hypothetical protein